MISQGIAVEVKGGAPAVREAAVAEPVQETATAPQAEPVRRQRRRGEPNDND